MTNIQSIAIDHLKKDHVLSKIIKTTNLVIIPNETNVYVSLIKSIVSQQLSTKAANTIYSRFTGLYDNNNLDPNDLINTELSTLRSIGLSKQKAQYVKNVAEFYLREKIIEKKWEVMSDQEILDALVKIKGVGKWTVQMVLMFNLNRNDVFPVDDLVIRGMMVHHYKVKEVGKEQIAKLEKIANKWRPYRSIACRYLWAFKDIPV